jgi:hypothetical protein
VTADVDMANNSFPRRPVKSRFQIFKDQQAQPNPMQLLERKQTPAPQPTPTN